MALDAKLLSVVQAIGADIKALFARVTPTIVRTTATQASSSATLTGITGLSAAVAAGMTYRVTGRVIFQASGLSTGATMGFAAPSGSNGLLAIAIGTTAARTSGASGSASASSVPAANTNYVASFDGLLTVGATSGNFLLQFAGSGTSTVTIQPGSVLVIEKLS